MTEFTMEKWLCSRYEGATTCSFILKVERPEQNVKFVDERSQLKKLRVDDATIVVEGCKKREKDAELSEK